MGRTLQDVISEWIVKLNNNEIGKVINLLQNLIHRCKLLDLMYIDGITRYRLTQAVFLYLGRYNTDDAESRRDDDCWDSSMQ